MKKYLFILIMPAIWNNLSAQLKTYSGEFIYQGDFYGRDAILGIATYTYKEENRKRIYHGKFSFTGHISEVKYQITGSYENGKKNGIWVTKNSDNMTLTETFSDGLLNGKWEKTKYHFFGGKLLKEKTIDFYERRNYVKGKLQGPYVYKEDNAYSFKNIEAFYNNDKLSGKYKYCGGNDKNTTIGQFDNNGVPFGLWVTHERNQTLRTYIKNGFLLNSTLIDNSTGSKLSSIVYEIDTARINSIIENRHKFHSKEYTLINDSIYDITSTIERHYVYGVGEEKLDFVLFTINSRPNYQMTEYYLFFKNFFEKQFISY